MPDVYPHGLPFSEILGTNLKDIWERIDLKKASLIIIDGGVGEGKTTMDILCANFFNELKDFPKIKLDGCQRAMGGSDFLHKIRLCYEQRLPVIIYDEAGDFSKRGSLTAFNAMLNRTFETYRAFKCVVIMSLPCFNVLDQQIFDLQIPRLLLHLKDRQEDYGNFDGYSLEGMMWLRYYMQKYKVNKNFAYTRVQPNFHGHFLDLPKTESVLLDKISTKDKISELQKSEVKIEGLMGYNDLSQKLGRSVIWIRKMVSELKIKHVRVIKKAKYFDENALNRLTDKAEGIDGHTQFQEAKA
jgi:hypothetical protein